MATNSPSSNASTASDTVSKIDAATKQAFSDAADKAAPSKATPKAVKAKVPTKKPTAKKVASKKSAPKVVAKKAAKKRSKPVQKKNIKTTSKKARQPASANPISQIKDTIMAKVEKSNIADTAKKTAKKTAKNMAADTQTRMKNAAGKATEFAGKFGGEFTDFSKGNVKAVVESGKILLAGTQEMGRDQLATGKTLAATVTADVKKMAAVKSPTELVQLQGELARRNVDAAISFGSKNTEAWLKIYNDAFAPISNRVSIAKEKFSKAA